MPALTNDVLYHTTVTSLTGLDSKRYSLQMSLVRSPGRPASGWRATLPIKGQNIQVDGRTPVEVYNAAVTVLGRNGLQVPATDIWLSLNIQWLSRTPEKHHLVPLSDLLHISKIQEPEAKDRDPKRRSYKPSDWGAIAWQWLNLFLAREEYHFRDFLTQCAYVLDMLNPATNSEIGCAECWKDFGKHVEKLKAQPGLDREGARHWLVDTHNAVSKKIEKKVLQYEEAAKKAFWI